MKVHSVMFKEPIRFAGKVDSFLSMDTPRDGLMMDFNQGMLRVEAQALPRPMLIPISNIVYIMAEEEAQLKLKK